MADANTKYSRNRSKTINSKNLPRNRISEDCPSEAGQRLPKSECKVHDTLLEACSLSGNGQEPLYRPKTTLGSSALLPVSTCNRQLCRLFTYMLKCSRVRWCVLMNALHAFSNITPRSRASLYDYMVFAVHNTYGYTHVRIIVRIVCMS